MALLYGFGYSFLKSLYDFKVAKAHLFQNVQMEIFKIFKMLKNTIKPSTAVL